MLAALAYGRDATAVVASGPPKSITCEDSFKSCTTRDSVATVVRARCLYRHTCAQCVCAAGKAVQLARRTHVSASLAMLQQDFVTLGKRVCNASTKL